MTGQETGHRFARERGANGMLRQSVFDLLHSVFKLAEMKRLFLLTSILLTAVATHSAQLSNEAKAAIRKELKALISEGYYPGVSILLIHEGKVVMREAHGVVDIDTKKPFTEDQFCWLASTGKMFTGTLMAMLVDEGVISFDEPIFKTFPEFAKIRLRAGSIPKSPPLLRQALSHTSGVPGNQWMQTNELLDSDKALAGYYFPKNGQEFIDGCIKLGLAVQPGTQLLYGRPIDLSACVVERKTGKTFIELMENKVFKPLGLKDATMKPTKAELKRLAPLYSSKKPHVFDPDSFGLEVAERQNTRLSAAGGAVYTTLDEIGVLLQLHLNRGKHQGRQLVKASTLAKLYEPQPGTKGRYGLAFQIGKSEINGRSTLNGHAGYSGPYAWFDFKRQLCGVLLLQSNTAGRGKLHQRVLDRIHQFIPAKPKVALIGDSIRLSYAPAVIKSLQAKAVIASPKANGGDSSRVLQNLDAWVIREQPDIVHFNCGIHDTKRFKESGKFQVSPEKYEANLRAIVKRIREQTEARIIFATTTPILDGRAADRRKGRSYELTNAAIEQYNEIARRVMRELKVEINDLNAAINRPGGAHDRNSLISGDGVHMEPVARELLGKQVAKTLRRQLSLQDAK